MTNTATSNRARVYNLGDCVSFADGTTWTITDIDSRESDGGREIRLYTLKNETGDVTVKTGRALTLAQDASSQPKSGDATPAASAPQGDAGRVLADIVGPHLADALALIRPGVDEDRVAEIVRREVQLVLPRRIEVVQIDGTTSSVGVQHASFEALLRAVTARQHVWLPGPAGSGKTSAAHAVADALTLPFYAVSVGPQTSQSQLLGYYDANGKYVTTQLRQAYEHGGVFLLDECDAGSPAVLVTINALLANGHAAFPDAVVERHKDFVLIAAGNTYGQGADRQYVGRQQIDAATLDRFAFLGWTYDPTLEAAWAGVPLSCLSGIAAARQWKFLPVDDAAAVQSRCEEYVREVSKVRVAIEGFGKAIRVLVGPRANFIGIALIRAGWTVEDALESCVWKGTDADTRKKIEAAR